MKYTMTTFEWKGGLSNLVVTTFRPQDEEPTMRLISVDAQIINNQYGQIRVIFGLTGDWPWTLEAEEFVFHLLRDATIGGRSNVGRDYYLAVNPVNGEPLTTSVMRAVVRLLMTCGIYTITWPRILTEHFEGPHEGAKNGVPNGKTLLEKILREELESRRTA